MTGDLLVGVAWAVWAVLVVAVWRVAFERRWWAAAGRFLGADLGPVSLWLGIVAVAAGVASTGLLAAAAVGGGAALIVAAVNDYRDRHRRLLERVERSVLSARQDAISDAVQGEVRALRVELGAATATLADRLEQAVEDILDDPGA